MEEKKNILTYEGLKKYEEELENLKVHRRQEVAQKIKEARAQGDLSENAEYDAAKDEVDLERINVGCRVKVKDMTEKEECDYKIVGSTEADSLKGKISNESPVGKALIGAKVGDTVKVEVGGNIFKYKVLEIQRSN